MRKRYPLPPPSASGQGHDLKTLRRLFPYIWPAHHPHLKVRVLLAVLCLVLAKGCSALVPLFYKSVVDLLSGDVADANSVGGAGGLAVAPWLAAPLVLIFAYGSARLLQQLFTELQDLVFAKVTERAVRAVGLQTFRHLHALSMRFHLDRQTGGLSRVIERGTRGIELMLRLVVFRSLPTVIELTVVCGLLWAVLDWRFSVITAVTIGLYGAYTMAITRWRARFRRAMNLSDAEAGAKSVDSLLNYETVKVFNTEDHEAERYVQALRRYEGAALRSKASLALLNGGQGMIIAIGLIALMGLAAQGVAEGTVTVGGFVMVNAYLLQLTLPLNFLGMLYRELKQALIDMEVMFAILDERPDITDSPQARPLAISYPPKVSFSDVSFSYDGQRRILKGVSFTIEAGESVAVVGASGAGKSTLSRLLYRFWDVDSGRIAIDGTDIRDLQQDSLRAAIGIVPQDCVLFNETLAYNITYGSPGATDQAIAGAIQAAQLDDFIASLPDGLETLVGERGLKLSGGEKQRVAVARALLKAPPILILDEATSALDSHTEHELQGALRALMADRTTLVVAHRLSTIIDSDRILVLADGVIQEQGTHAALLAQGGLYAALWARQAQTQGNGAPP